MFKRMLFLCALLFACPALASDAGGGTPSYTINGVAVMSPGSYTITAAAGTLTGSTLAANVTSSSLTSLGVLGSLTKIDLNNASLPAAQSGTVLQIGNANGTPTRFEADAFGSTAYYSAVAFGGTNASPVAVGTAVEIGGLNVRAYNGTGVSVNPIAALRFFSAAAQTTASAGTYADIATTPIGTTAEAEVLRFENDAGMDTPGVTGGDMGAGTINAQGFYVNGSPLPTKMGGTGQSYNSGFLRAQKAALAAQNSNLVRNPVTSITTITSPASAPSTTGFTDLFGTNRGYIANISGTTTLNSNVLTSVSSTASCIVGQPIVEYAPSAAYPAHIPLNAVITACGTNTITMSYPATGSGSLSYIYLVNDKLSLVGGYPADYGGNLGCGAATTGNSVVPPTAQNIAYEPCALHFKFDGGNFTTSAVSLMLWVYTNGANPASFRVAVDGNYQSANPVAFGSTGAAYLSIQFTTAGIHDVWIELPPLMLLQNLYVTTGSSISKVQTPYPVESLVFGDSYFQSGASGSWSPNNMGMQTSQLLGWNPRLAAVGGTGWSQGYPNTSQANYDWASPYRLQDLTRGVYDVIVVYGSVNDMIPTIVPATITANCLTWLQAARAAQPNSAIFVFGTNRTNGYTDTSAALVENAVSSAVTTFNDPNTFFIPITTSADGDWLTSGNVSTYIVDGTHLGVPNGVNFMAYHMAAAINAILQNGRI